MIHTRMACSRGRSESNNRPSFQGRKSGLKQRRQVLWAHRVGQTDGHSPQMELVVSHVMLQVRDMLNDLWRASHTDFKLIASMCSKPSSHNLVHLGCGATKPGKIVFVQLAGDLADVMSGVTVCCPSGDPARWILGTCPGGFQVRHLLAHENWTIDGKHSVCRFWRGSIVPFYLIS